MLYWTFKKLKIMKHIITVIIVSFLTLFVSAQKFTTDQKLLKEFQDMKFGMFVHWGPVSLKGTEIGWSRGRQVPNDEYDNLYKQFNPTKFNADEWIKTLKDAGEVFCDYNPPPRWF